MKHLHQRQPPTPFRPNFFQAIPIPKLIQKGGPGSGNYGHAGRPGEVGGSASSGINVENLKNLSDNRYQKLSKEVALWPGKQRQEYAKNALDAISAGARGFAITAKGLTGIATTTEIRVGYDQWHGPAISLEYMATAGHGSGYGRALFRQVALYAASKKLPLVLTSAPKAIGFYRKMGMVAVGDRREGYQDFLILPKDILAIYKNSNSDDEPDDGIFTISSIQKGGPGSGNFGHVGRPGEIGGSGPGAGIALPPAGREWVDHKEGVPKNTRIAHQVEGKYKPERLKLHQQIEDDAVSKVRAVPEGQQPQAILMMGGTASGKSSIIRGISQNDFVTVDSDAVKDRLPEYRESVAANARDAAFITHDESGDVADRIRDRAIAEGKNVIIDGTGKTAKTYEDAIAQLRARGYKVTVMMPDLDVETALGRARLRAEKTGRWVPEPVVRDIYSKAPKNFERIARQADDFFLFDNRGERPRLVWERKNGVETIHDDGFVSRFRGK